MDIQNIISDCVGLLSSMKNEVIFSEPIVIKSSPHVEVFRCYGASTKDERLAVMDVTGDWHEVLPDQINVYPVASSLLQRLKLLAYVNN